MAIRMTPSELMDLANTLTNIRNDIADLVKTMNERVDIDTRDWDGESKTRYFTDYDAILPTLQKTFPDVIEDLAKKLTFAASKLDEADRDIASAIRN